MYGDMRQWKRRIVTRGLKGRRSLIGAYCSPDHAGLSPREAGACRDCGVAEDEWKLANGASRIGSAGVTLPEAGRRMAGL
jgi:hypothetical protein